MAGRIVTALTRREQCLLLDILGPGWMLAWMLLDDDGIDHVRSSWLGGHVRSVRSGFADDGRTFFQVGKRGVALGRIERDPVGFVPAEVITWASIRAHRAALPVAVIETIREARVAALEHQRAYPTFHRPADPGEFADAHIAFHRDVVQPWATELTRLTIAERDAVLAAFPDTTDDEPTDLFEVLALLDGDRS